jgi:phospholipid/cholesterol/gamma-HCH transport system substrate-binding protein
MYYSKTRIKVGITVIVALLILGLGYSWLTEFRVRKHRTYYKIWFREVGWINKGDVVTVLGVPKGRVKDIELYPDSVVVGIWIEDYKLREGAKAWLESLGIIGQMRLALTLGKGDTLPPGSIIRGETRVGLGEVISNLGEFLERSDSLLLVGVSLLSNTSNVLGEASMELKNLFVKISELVEEMRNLLQYGKTQIDTTSSVLNTLIAKIDSLQTLLLKGEGTAGKLIKDETLYNESIETIRELRSLIKDVRENPEKYFKIEIF